MSYYSDAEKKLTDGMKDVSGNYQKAMMHATKDALLSFCRQDDEFAEAVAQGGSFKDCMNDVAKGVTGGSISDLEAYRRAVQFYFKGADISFQMTIDLCASVKGETAAPKILDLADFF